ncbi:MAG: hypothetical protein ACI9KE_004006, partial [Polyangiales bacterium]
RHLSFDFAEGSRRVYRRYTTGRRHVAPEEKCKNEQPF